MRYGNDKLPSLWGYPGSKKKAVDFLYYHVKGHQRVVSPFLGAGSFERNLAYRGHEVIGYDYSPDISNLWEQVMKNHKDLSFAIQKKAGIYRTQNHEEYTHTFKMLYKQYFVDGKYTEPFEKAVIYWILQQTAFSGIIASGFPSDAYPTKLSDEVLKRMYYFNSYSFEFGGRKSFEESIKLHKNDFLILDPPYYGEDYKTHPLYGTKYNPELHSDFDHIKLAEILTQRSNWAMTYNNCDEVIALYKGKVKDIIPFDLTYTVGNSKGKGGKKGKELLIIG